MDSEAKKILELIEAVDINDTAALDEIDARVWCWLNHANPDAPSTYGNSNNVPYWKIRIWHYGCELYTRSRDALKSIRPEGWDGYTMAHYGAHTSHRFWKCGMSSSISIVTTSTGLPTEELAELHAIIQAIAYERSK